MAKHGFAWVLLAATAPGAIVAAGCDEGQLRPTQDVPASQPACTTQAVPAPIDLLLPRSIRLHPFTGTRVFSEAGGVTGIDVRIEAFDAYGDASKAFGHFRFELFAFKPNSPDPRGERLGLWNVSVDGQHSNRKHWSRITRTYQFKLGWNQPIPVGRKFVLAAAFQSPFTPRLFDQRVFVSGQ